jgi:hypothetical protein
MLSTSLDSYPGDDALIRSTRYADASIPPLVHRFGTPKDEYAPLMLKEPNNGAPREAHQRGNFIHGVSHFVGHLSPDTEKASAMCCCMSG